jgi:hypothetical protein
MISSQRLNRLNASTANQISAGPKIFQFFHGTQATSPVIVGFNRTRKGEISTMKKKLIATALAVLAFGLAPRSNAGTEIIRDYGATAPAYNYAPPPRPVYYAPPPVSVVVYPTYRYFGPRVVVFGAHRFYPRRAFFRHRHWW